MNIEARIKKLEKHQQSEERGNTCLPIFVQYSESQKALTCFFWGAGFFHGFLWAI